MLTEKQQNILFAILFGIGGLYISMNIFLKHRLPCFGIAPCEDDLINIKSSIIFTSLGVIVLIWSLISILVYLKYIVIGDLGNIVSLGLSGLTLLLIYSLPLAYNSLLGHRVVSCIVYFGLSLIIIVAMFGIWQWNKNEL